jgi:hypothetical protein
LNASVVQDNFGSHERLIRRALFMLSPQVSIVRVRLAHNLAAVCAVPGFHAKPARGRIQHDLIESINARRRQPYQRSVPTEEAADSSGSR